MVGKYVDPWYADIANYLAKDIIPPEMNYEQRKRFFSTIKHYLWDDPYLFKICADGMIRRCVQEHEVQDILTHCHTK